MVDFIVSEYLWDEHGDVCEKCIYAPYVPLDPQYHEVCKYAEDGACEWVKKDGENDEWYPSHFEDGSGLV